MSLISWVKKKKPENRETKTLIPKYQMHFSETHAVFKVITTGLEGPKK